jgi:hypothetical protein
MKPYGWRFGAWDFDRTDTLCVRTVAKKRGRKHGRAVIAEQVAALAGRQARPPVI